MTARQAAEVPAGTMRILVERIEALARDLVDGTPPMVVDALAEAWRMGLTSEAGRTAIVISARRGCIVVCSPLADPAPAAAILSKAILPGMSMDRVRSVCGAPTRTIGNTRGVTWLHALPCIGHPEDESDGTPYPLRQAAWPRDDASYEDPPFAPLFAGERIFIETEFSNGAVTRSRVTVLPDLGTGVNAM